MIAALISCRWCGYFNLLVTGVFNFPQFVNAQKNAQKHLTVHTSCDILTKRFIINSNSIYTYKG